MEKALIDKGTVLEITKWEPPSMYQLVLGLPETDMSKWTTIPRIKCKVADFEYRDYSPAMWDIKKRICSVFVETGHEGPGSRWAKSLHVGDPVFFGAAHAASLPGQTGKVLCLGDGSSLGHFLALKQLTDRVKHPLDVLLHLNDAYHLDSRLTSDNPDFTFLTPSGTDAFEALSGLLQQKTLSDYSSIYIAGHIPLVQQLRKRLKNNPAVRARIYGHGFWS